MLGSFVVGYAFGQGEAKSSSSSTKAAAQQECCETEKAKATKSAAAQEECCKSTEAKPVAKGEVGCCNAKGASRVRDYAKARVKELGLAGKGKVRVNQAGCLDRCEEGPVVVVYPEGVWYTYVDEEDVDEIIREHLVHGRPVDRLKI